MDITSTLRDLHNTLPMEEQFRRSTLFRCSLSENGFSHSRIEEICDWIKDNPSGVKSIFRSWVNIFERGFIRDDEVDSWYGVAKFLAYGGEVQAKPYELALAEQAKRRFIVNSLNQLLQTC